MNLDLDCCTTTWSWETAVPDGEAPACEPVLPCAATAVGSTGCGNDRSESRDGAADAVHLPPGPRRLDLGCGKAKQPGFLGADRLALPGVDIVLDLDRPLPFADDTFDLVYASHSLEHVRDLMCTIQEIYRVCKDGAQVCILAPYYQQAGNLANPYHLQTFNEHTPRFWTNSPVTPIDPAEYVHPHAPCWGLAESDNLAREIDLRCLRMEFFYFPEYRGLPADEQRQARKKYLDVCDQVLYHLIAFKHAAGEEEVRRIAREMDYYEPEGLAARRSTGTPSPPEGPPVPRADAVGLARQLDAFRHRRVVRWIRRLSDRSDLFPSLPAEFGQMKDDSLLFSPLTKGYHLQLGACLQRAGHVAYPLVLERAGLSGLLLAFDGDVRLAAGQVGIRIVSPDGRQFLASSLVPATEINTRAPVRFAFPPLEAFGRKPCWLQVFAQNVDVPLYLLEWRKYPCLGLRKTKTLPFFGLMFDQR